MTWDQCQITFFCKTTIGLIFGEKICPTTTPSGQHAAMISYMTSLILLFPSKLLDPPSSQTVLQNRTFQIKTGNLGTSRDEL